MDLVIGASGETPRDLAQNLNASLSAVAREHNVRPEDIQIVSVTTPSTDRWALAVIRLPER